VAPDKGTARFSDLANAISIERSFWLGDAFASGGSHGYDHKALGITARGAWMAVRRHFRALGMDAQHDEVRVVGVGDMSGDVFGNGMLQSRSVRLVAAFDHRHVFIDPAPGPDRSFAERLRLSRLTGSSWADFDLAAASPGAVVVARHAKQVELSPEACTALGCGPGPMSPPELVKAVLCAPVDLIFFGGVGTFVKAATESDYDVDDAVNDDVRVNADQLRARVVVEGANLAVTPRARTSYSRRGGRVNTDFIDNAAGVVMSDREVNLKILFGMAGSSALLGPGGRDDVMKAAEDDAATAVLDTVDGSLVALDQAALGSANDLPAFEALLGDLEHSGALDRDAEALPGVEELARRRDAGAGLSRPELAVVLAFARSALARSVERSALVADPALAPGAVRYFPTVVRRRFAHLIPAHPLFAQLLSSELANEVVRRMGATWAHELATETGSQLWEVAGAYWSASRALGAAGLAEAVDGLAWSVGADAENALRAVLTGAVDRLARWYLGQRPRRLPGEVLALDGPLGQVLQGGELPVEVPADIKKLGDLGVPSEVVLATAQLAALSAVGELGEVARASQRSLADVVPAHGVVATELSLPSLVQALHEWPALDRWQRWQVHALVADLAAVRVTCASNALVTNPGTGGAEAAHLWLEARRPAVSRALWLVQELTGGGRPNLPLAAVAVAALGQLPLAAAVM
jgi:glutamate dehydrogenase